MPDKNSNTQKPVDPEQPSLFEKMVDSGEPVMDPPVQEPGMAATSLSVYSNTPQFDREDIIMPRLHITQGLSKEVQEGFAKPGMWLISGSEAKEQVTVIPLAFSRRRELRDEDFNTLCSSEDAVTGIGNPGGECRACMMNQWTQSPTGKRVPPQCTFFYSYIVYVVELRSPAIIDFKRTAIGAGKMLNTIVGRTGIGKTAVTLKVSTQKGNRGNYYVPVVQPTTATPEMFTEAAGSF